MPATSSVLSTSLTSEHSNFDAANFLKKKTGTFHPHIPTGIALIALSPATPRQNCLLCRHILKKCGRISVFILLQNALNPSTMM
ncbi:hypothetical protein H6F73_11710 [Microcoleus sp. FACHB-68]|nr:hypothetical protein [Microcoleus sp. FACHB-68]